MKIFLIVCIIIGVGIATGGVGFLVAIIAWIAVAQAELEVKREEERWKKKWYGDYK